VICFRFFSLGRCVPIVRGGGVYQPGLDFCRERLHENAWVHVFPEGKVNEEKTEIRLKWGVGRLLAEAECSPTLLPLWHIGMDDVLPNQRPYIPQIGKKVTILFGEPIEFRTLLDKLRERKASEVRRRRGEGTITTAGISLVNPDEEPIALPHLHRGYFPSFFFLCPLSPGREEEKDNRLNPG
jgi:1-acyl-sn-glycerol-3-phosphate acyltransferase